MPAENTRHGAFRCTDHGEPPNGRSTSPRPSLAIALIGVEDGRGIHYDNRLCEMLSCTRRALRELSWIDIVHPEDRETARQQLHLASEGMDDRYHSDIRLLSPSRGPVPARVEAECVRGADGEALFLVVLIQPAAREEPESDSGSQAGEHRCSLHKIESIGSVAAAVGHNFNNLLLPILGHAELLAQEMPASFRGREHIQAIVDAARQASKLCAELLVHSGAGAIERKPLDANKLLAGMAKRIRDLGTRRAPIQLELSPAPLVIDGDAEQIQGMIVNILTNAVESMEGRRGVITLRTDFRQCSRTVLDAAFLGGSLGTGEYAVIEIADMGCGMDAEARARLFEPFYSTKFGHAGTGLATVLGMMRRHLGALELESEPGEGTVVRCLLPLSRRPEQRVEPMAEGLPEVKFAGAVLLVDDEEPVLRVGRFMLEKLGFSVVVARGGVEAVDLHLQRRGELACIILDVSMPDMDGEAVYDAIRRVDDSTPILISSGHAQKLVLGRFEGKGASGLLAKPYGLEELREALRAALR
ncbi:MAG: response regulator [Syntrophobacteraceae bacterium]|nr:response regulator [Syntrophobacteraceae bacterium]